ncbi:MAG: hypothetical protein OXE94_00700 [Aestuariivita sp.]|nr:hypothetical protein [Aestuariivita sp.]MCY4202637.1 hypothetical protein [Aestuariivita sp.]MCY4289539.1 hypothetical protein [Aestuariivita sp.]MCY4348153.1 hypothetical protein [Aestuariivita sp.]
MLRSPISAVARIDCHKSASLPSIVIELCEREDWRNDSGDLCLVSACLALPAIARRLQLELPAASSMGQATAASRSPKRGYRDRVVACSFAAAGTISVVPVTAAATAEARSMLLTHHPLGDAVTPCRCQHYWLVSSVHGRLGQLVAGRPVGIMMLAMWRSVGRRLPAIRILAK